jgi:CspA family cold shock protein
LLPPALLPPALLPPAVLPPAVLPPGGCFKSMRRPMIAPIAIAGTGGNVQVGRATAIDTLEMVMATGTVKWFNPTKGYGFIQPQSGGQDVFVHISAVEKAGLATLNEGQQVEFEIVSNRGKSSAENLKVK